MSIGDFAMNLIDNGAIKKDVSFGKGTAPQPSPVDSFQRLPEADFDVSDTEVSDQLVENILQNSFGVQTQVSENQVQEVPEPTNEVESLREEVESLKEELTGTIKQFTSILSRLFEITEMTGAVTSTQSGMFSSAGKAPDPMNPRNKKSKKKKVVRRKKRGRS